jgi:palmitoyltransferase ZDHHC13/17
MRDAKLFTVLSFAAYKNQEDAFISLFNHALEYNLVHLSQFRSFEEKKSYLTGWVNAQTDEGFTAIHFATYHGNFSLIKFLIETANADMTMKNKFGSSVMHVAA